MNLTTIEIWSLLAGLGLFLYGIHLLEESLKALAGRSFKIFLRKQTGNPVKAVASGALVTAALQSSSLVTLLVMSFAGAGIIGLNNGVGMILGANLGTTITGWLVTLIGFKMNIETLVLPLIAISGLGILFLKSENLLNLCKILMGFSLMFLGLNYMKIGVLASVQQFDFTIIANKNGALFLLTAFILTAAIQSSSAAIMIFLTSVSAGVIPFEKALYLVIGADLGTTVTALINTINANSIKRKVGYAQFFFNVFSAVPALLFMSFYLYVIENILGFSDPLVKLVSFHSLMNFAGIVLILPMLNYFTRFINRLVPVNNEAISKNLTLVNPTESHAALEILQKESQSFIQSALHILNNFFHVSKHEKQLVLVHNYTDLKNYENELASYYIKMQQSKLNEKEVDKINNIIGAIRNATLSAKNIKDIKHNLSEIYDSPDEDLHSFYQSIRKNQEQFYKEIEEVISNFSLGSLDDLQQIKELDKSRFHAGTEKIYSLFSQKKHREIVIADMLNMIREISESNQALIRSLNYLMDANKV